MSKRQDAKRTQPQRRIFPNDYTREDLIAELVATGAESYRQAEQIEALKCRMHELERPRRLDTNFPRLSKITRLLARLFIF
jgi:hypothetical protein